MNQKRIARRPFTQSSLATSGPVFAMKTKCVRDTIATIEASTDTPELIRIK